MSTHTPYKHRAGDGKYENEQKLYRFENGYVSTFIALQYGWMTLVEYVCPDGHRIHVRTETIDWQAKGVVWQ